MARRFRRVRGPVVVGWIGVFFTPAPALAIDAAADHSYPPTPLPTDPARLRADAETAERAGRWETALDNYLWLHLSVGPSAEVRDKVRLCLRHAAQFRRHRDPTFQQFVLSLPAAEALNLYADVMSKLGMLYVDKDRATPARLFVLGVEELDRAFGDPTFPSGRTGTPAEAKVQAFRQSLRTGWAAKTPATPKEARQLARDLIAAAHDQAGMTNPAAVVLELLGGACGGLDEYTTYTPPAGEMADPASPAAEFAAYGVVVRSDAGELVIDSVLPNSWAGLNTPLRKGQRIVQINGRAVTPALPGHLAEALRAGPPFAHLIEVVDGEMPAMAPEPVRLPVPAPTTFTADLGVLKDGVGYLRLAAFREGTPREIDEQVLDLRSRGMRALVLDLRGNPGGLFTAAVDVAQRFLPGGVVVAARGQSAEFADRVFSSAAGPAAWDFPVVLLVDTRTMSAAEVVAAALKENRVGDRSRATLVGTPTFGKGVVQSPVRLQRTDGGDGGVLVLTVAALAGPGGAPLNGGVSPHVLETDPARQLELAVQKAVELARAAH